MSEDTQARRNNNCCRHTRIQHGASTLPGRAAQGAGVHRRSATPRVFVIIPCVHTLEWRHGSWLDWSGRACSLAALEANCRLCSVLCVRLKLTVLWPTFPWRHVCHVDYTSRIPVCAISASTVSQNAKVRCLLSSLSCFSLPVWRFFQKCWTSTNASWLAVS